LQGGRLLEVGVYDTDILLPIRQIVSQQNTECGLAHTAFLIGKNNTFVIIRFHYFTILLLLTNVSLLFERKHGAAVKTAPAFCVPLWQCCQPYISENFLLP
jgi:hypothetical protein